MTNNNDLLHLKQFLINPEAKKCYASLVSEEKDRDEDIVEYADDPSIDKIEDIYEK